MKRLFNTLFLFLLGGIVLAQTSRESCSEDRAYLGIYTQEVSAEKAALLQLPNHEGSLISEVFIGGAADKAGLQAFDYLYGIDEYRTDSGENLTDLLSKYKAGDQANVHLIRKGQPLTVNLVFGRRSDSVKPKKDDAKSPFLGISNRSSKDDEMGIVVGIIPNSTAMEMGLRSGDKILAINDFPIVNWSDVSMAINTMQLGDPVVVAYEREGLPMKAESIIKGRVVSQEYDEQSRTMEYAFLGIYSNIISKAKAKKLGFENPYGSYVSSVIGNTAAERADIQPFDYIYGIDEYRTGEGQSLTHILRRYRVGEEATVHFVRRNQDRQISVTFGSREEARREETDRCEEPFLGVQSSHSYVERTGVSVNIIRNSTAQTLGMQDNDLITRINGYLMIDWEDISTAINNMDVGSTIEVNWVRNGRDMQGSAAIMSYCQTKTNQIVPDRIPRTTQRPDSRLDLKEVEIIVSDISRAETDEMKRRHNVDLHPANELGMQSIRITTRPEKGIFQLSFDLPNRGRTVVRIYNDQGRNIYEYDLGAFSGPFSDEVDLSQNGAGTYYLLVQQNGKSAGKKIILKNG